jgi:hypothetical protein
MTTEGALMQMFLPLPPPPLLPNSVQKESKKQFIKKDCKRGIKLIQTPTKLIWLDI